MKIIPLFISLAISLLVIAGCSKNDSSVSNANDSYAESEYIPEETDNNVNHYFTGVYYLARAEKGLISGYRHTDYFVEFYDDGTAMWWDYPEYQSQTYYVGSYTYNESRDCYNLKIESHPTYIVTKTENAIEVVGGKFSKETFRKSKHDNIYDAADDWWTPIQELRDSY